MAKRREGRRRKKPVPNKAAQESSVLVISHGKRGVVANLEFGDADKGRALALAWNWELGRGSSPWRQQDCQHARSNYSSMMLFRPPTSNSNPKKLLVRPDAPVAEGSWQTAPAAPGSCRGRNWPIVYLIRLKNPLNRPVSLHVFALCRTCLFFLGVFFLM